MKTKHILGLFFALLIYTSNKAQSIYMSSVNLKGEATSGTHANQVPVEAFEFLYDRSIKIRKKINNSSIELMKRNHNESTADINNYIIRFYDSNDVNYYTITLQNYSVVNYIPTEPFIVSPQNCSVSNLCSGHYEEIKLTPYNNAASQGCTSNCLKIIYKNEITGDTYTYQ